MNYFNFVPANLFSMTSIILKYVNTDERTQKMQKVCYKQVFAIYIYFFIIVIIQLFINQNYFLIRTRQIKVNVEHKKKNS